MSGCDWQRFHAWLDAPLLAADEREDARIRARRDALMRGEIPA